MVSDDRPVAFNYVRALLYKLWAHSPRRTLHIKVIKGVSQAGIFWKVIAKTGAVSWKKLEIISGPEQVSFSEKRPFHVDMAVFGFLQK